MLIPINSRIVDNSRKWAIKWKCLSWIQNVSNELYITELFLTTYFIESNKFPVKLLYPRWSFLAMRWKNLSSSNNNDKDSCDFSLKFIKSNFLKKVDEELQAVEDTVVLVDKATSNNCKETMGVSVSYFN